MIRPVDFSVNIHGIQVTAGIMILPVPQGTKLMGLGTGNPVSEEDYFSDTCSLYEGRALLVIRRDIVSAEVPVVRLVEE